MPHPTATLKRDQTADWLDPRADIRRMRSAMRDAHHERLAVAESAAEPHTPAPAYDLSTQNLWFRIALNNLNHGVSIFDAHSRLIYCNSAYLDMYRLSPERVKPGCSLRELIEHRVRAGTFLGDADQVIETIVDAIRERKTVRRVNELIDGRVIAVLTSPVIGDAWMALHEDVTEQRDAERKLVRTKNFLDTVINHVPAAILVKHARTLRYVLINKKGEDYLGLPRDQVIGRTAYDLFPLEAAEVIDAKDRATLSRRREEWNQGDRYECAPLHRPDDTSQTILGQKLIVPGSDGEPEYLLSVIEDVTDRVQTTKQLSHQAHHDALTGLANRMLFTKKVDAALERLRQRGERFSILFLDLDRFKSVNDSLGHTFGDDLLKAVAQRMQTLLQDNEFIARLGGDEFAILQVCAGDQRETAITLASRIQDTVGATYQLKEHQIVIGTSIGIACAPDHGTDAEHLLQCADLALYQSKSQGRNRFSFFEPTLEIEARARHALETDLREAIAHRTFELHYQPMVDLATGRCHGAEALVRWRKSPTELVDPARFIALAEETGLIVPLGEWILRTACLDAMAWPAEMKVAVNLSAVQFGKGDLVGTVSRALLDSGLPPHRLELEITESVLLRNNDENVALLHTLKNLGISIVLDDFGTGYSSLSYLKMFPFDKIKIDKSFVGDISTRSDCAAIVCAIIALGKSLGMHTTAEGVETDEQVALLRAAGCQSAQGYLFSPPVRDLTDAFSTSKSRTAATA